jgi:hypothetical protein
MDIVQVSSELQQTLWDKTNSSLAYLHDGQLLMPTTREVFDSLDTHKYSVVNIHNTRKTLIFVNQNNEIVYMSLTPDKYKRIDCSYFFLLKLTQMLFSLEVSPITKIQHLKNFVGQYEDGRIKPKTMKRILDIYQEYLTSNIADKNKLRLQQLKNVFAFGCNFKYVSFSQSTHLD